MSDTPEKPTLPPLRDEKDHQLDEFDTTMSVLMLGMVLLYFIIS